MNDQTAEEKVLAKVADLETQVSDLKAAGRRFAMSVGRGADSFESSNEMMAARVAFEEMIGLSGDGQSG